MRKGQDGTPEKFPFGWRHQAIRAEFVHCDGSVSTDHANLHADRRGREDATRRPAGRSILSQWLNQERNGQVLRSIRFWSLVLTRGNKEELVIVTGNEKISDFSQSSFGFYGLRYPWRFD